MAITQGSDRNRRVIVIDDGTGTKKFRTVGSRSHCQTGSFGSFGESTNFGSGLGKDPSEQVIKALGVTAAGITVSILMFPFSIITGSLIIGTYFTQESQPVDATEATQCDPHEGIY